MQDEIISYEVGGLTLKSRFFARLGAEPKASVLVFPEAFGLGEHAISRAERLAELGYVALACDVYGDGRFIPDLDEAMGLLKPLYENTVLMIFGGLADKMEARAMLIIGPAGAALAYVWMALSQEASLMIDVIGPMALLGTFFAVVVGPLTASVMSSVGQADEGLASGINMRRAGLHSSPASRRPQV